MLISTDRRFAFVHVPKTGGTSICRALAEPSDMTFIGKLQYPIGKRMRQEVGDQKWTELFTFAFVRNPWSRLVEWYIAIRQRPSHPHHVRARGQLVQFEEFLKYAPNFGIPIWRNQVDWIMDGDRIIVDFVGRFETLRDDFAAVCQKIGVTAELPYKASQFDYRAFYGPKLRGFVTEKYSRDIEAFGYAFQ